MSRFVISPHFRLQEWVAEEKGYFAGEGLDYEFREAIGTKDSKGQNLGDRVGAYQTIERGRQCDVSAACHWTINVAASAGHGKLYGDAYSVSPAGVFVAPESPVREPKDLAGVPISVGYQSGSHYATIQALEQYMPLEDITLSFADGLIFSRMEKLFDRQVPAASVFSGAYYFLEELGFRKIIDSTFMMASIITGDPDPDDVRKYFRALRRAQRDIDLRPEPSTPTTIGRNSPSDSARSWTPGGGAPASGSSSSPIRRRPSRTRSGGSPSAAFSPRARWDQAATRAPSSRWRSDLSESVPRSGQPFAQDESTGGICGERCR